MTPLDAMAGVFAPLRTHAFAYPVLEVMHIMGIALLLGNLVLLELRVWGVASALPVRHLARATLPLVVAGMGLAALSGSLMLASQINDLITNRALVAKLVLLAAAGCNAVWFHARDSLGKLDGVARLQTAISTLIWISIIECGRWNAYL